MWQVYLSVQQSSQPVVLLPPVLNPGDTIAFISPSARLNEVQSGALQRAKNCFEHLGYKTKIIFNSTPKTFKDTVRLRCDEIHAAFSDPEVKAIVCTIGGSHANELLNHLDYELIRSNPKIFCGYSDITVLHCAISTQTGLVTFYGPAALSEFGEYPKPFEFTLNHFVNVVQGNGVGPVPRSLEWAEKLPDYFIGSSPLKPRKLSPNPGWTWLRPGKAKGRIFGGFLPSLLHLAGTKYWPDLKDKILVLENPTGEALGGPLSLTSTRAKMAKLVNIGVFGQIKGLVIGRPFGYNEVMRKEFAQMVNDQCDGTDFPVLLDVDIGHTSPIVTIPLNIMVSLDSSVDEFYILEQCVVDVD